MVHLSARTSILSLAPLFAAFSPASSLIARSNYSTWMASSIMSRQQGVLTGTGDSSELLQAGFTQKAFRQLIDQHPDEAQYYNSYVSKSVESVIPVVINATKDTTYPLDRFSSGNNLIHFFLANNNDTYLDAIHALRESIDLQPRNAEGGLWYYIYPQWSYLDGMYSFAPFLTAYTTLFDADPTLNTTAINDVLFQLDLLWQHCLRNDSGLLVHGYDDSKTAVWADPATGASPHVWGRSLGWYVMALADLLEIIPVEHDSDEWKTLKSRFQQLAFGVVDAVDPDSGAWWQLLDQPGREGNYIESSGSAMFVYGLLKGSRLGYIPSENATAVTELASRAYEYVVDTFVVDNGNGTISYNGTVSVCSLNSTASYEYYVGQPIKYDSVLGSAAFVLASLEYERLS
ncbi:hypothetical protein D9758_016676 [Tetrapyrgos nigripes]|uniref:Uncharacterized protein n=1 Tax=Tetrapyrgos nigripes TaxID=182062 RepID=A0A8H5CBK9_9AGAR|nr:hypothetical protein D9758_016676 [Tetrapyrgos nigripes]